MLTEDTLSYDNALDHALGRLHAAATALERNPKPTLVDVEDARDRAKAAFKVLEASHTLLALGLYKVGDDPNAAKDAAKGTPMFDPDLQPTADAEAGAAPAPESEAPAVPALGCATDPDAVDVEIIAHPLDGLDDEAARATYEEKVEAFITAGIGDGEADDVRADWLKAEPNQLRYHFDLLVWALESGGPFGDSGIVAEGYEAAHHVDDPTEDASGEVIA